MTTDFLSRHRERLDDAVAASATRGYYSAFDESPSPRVYGENAAADGKAAYEAWLDRRLPARDARQRRDRGDRAVAVRLRPGGALPAGRHDGVDALIGAAGAGLKAWRDAGPEGRTGVCLEILDRLHGRVFELANAVQHTSGQAFVMAFQAGGAHALDRALEAIAYALHRDDADARHRAVGEARPGEPLRMEKTFTVVPRGVALVIGCNTFPTWNSWPGLFASLVTGNPVVVKPHPAAVLPLAITVQACQEVLAEAGFDPQPRHPRRRGPGRPAGGDARVRPEVKLIDFTGGNAFGEWLEENARQATVFTEKAGVNTVVVDSTDNFKAMCQNLAFSFALYTGQMCTAPQNVYLPADGIATEDGQKSVAEVAGGSAPRSASCSATTPARSSCSAAW